MMNKRYLILSLGLLAIPIFINTRSRMTVNEWERRYFIKALAPDHKQAMASCICYLSRTTPTEQNFVRELATARTAFPTAPNYFKLALMKVFEQSFIQAYEASQLTNPNKYWWKRSLLEFYKPIWNSLPSENKTFNYGPQMGNPLPDTQTF